MAHELLWAVQSVGSVAVNKNNSFYRFSLTVPWTYKSRFLPAPLASATCVVDSSTGGLPATMSARGMPKSCWASGVTSTTIVSSALSFISCSRARFCAWIGGGAVEDGKLYGSISKAEGSRRVELKGSPHLPLPRALPLISFAYTAVALLLASKSWWHQKVECLLF